MARIHLNQHSVLEVGSVSHNLSPSGHIESGLEAFSHAARMADPKMRASVISIGVAHFSMAKEKLDPTDPRYNALTRGIERFDHRADEALDVDSIKSSLRLGAQLSESARDRVALDVSHRD